jgi:predicted nucleic acid-binding Zn ribbon protein
MSGEKDRAGRHCYKCGREIGFDQTICEVCNRAGMATPSATQYHGTIVVAIVAGVAIMAVWASLSLRGIGPFGGAVVSFRSDPPDGVVATLQITNTGSRAGRAKCRMTARDASGATLRVRDIVSAQVAAGASIKFEERIPGLPVQPAEMVILCS